MRYFLAIMALLSMQVSLAQTDSLRLGDTGVNEVDANGALEAGTVIQTTRQSVLQAVRFYKTTSTDASVFTINIWKFDNGEKLHSQQFTASGRSGWIRTPLNKYIELDSLVRYIVSVHIPSARYRSRINAFLTQQNASFLVAPASGTVNGNGRYVYGVNSNFPSSQYSASYYFVNPVVSVATPRNPLVVNAGKDSTLMWPRDSIRLIGKIGGDGVTFKWTGDHDSTWSSTQLEPMVKNLKYEYTTFTLTATDKYGVTARSNVIIRAIKVQQLLLSNGTWIPWPNQTIIPLETIYLEDLNQ